MSDYITFYDRTGQPLVYLANDGKSIFTYSGTPVAYLDNDSVFNYHGIFLGWFTDGWLIDLFGRRVFFTQNAEGGPVKPVKKVRSVRGIKSVKPIKGVKQVRPVKPVYLLSWSDLSWEQFFQTDQD